MSKILKTDIKAAILNFHSSQWMENGFHDSKTCGNIKKKKNPNQPSKLERIQELVNDDVFSPFKTVSTNLICCDTATYKEKWLIMHHIRVELPQDSTICGRHCSVYTHDCHKSARCQHPGHAESKKKLSLTGISLKAAYQSQFLFGSVARRVIVPIGASWCSNCKLQNMYASSVNEGK